MNTRTPQCPSDLALERHLLETDLTLSTHVQGCAHCEHWMKAAVAAGRAFESNAPQLLRQVRATSSKPISRWAMPVAALAAMCLVTVAYVARREEEPRFAVKGAPLLVYIKHADAVREATEGERVQPGDELRFFVSPRKPSHVWVVSVDTNARVSKLAPAGDEAFHLAEPGLLPGSAILDSAEGPERIYALLSPRPLSFRDVEAALERMIGSAHGEELVRNSNVPKLDGVEVATVLLERWPR